jgi:hypothetical protein
LRGYLEAIERLFGGYLEAIEISIISVMNKNKNI